jgi:3-isopropylmalate/(R)-2-methylmalate dehydratase small subunit
MTISGRTWIFGDGVDTDVMIPAAYLHSGPEDQMKALFQSVRPGWVDAVTSGDVIVAGHNFGVGSSRPAARGFALLGIGLVIADSIGGLFLRSCVSYGLLALECPSVSKLFDEGDIAELSLDRFEILNVRTGERLPVTPLPQMLLDLMLQGGVMPLLEARNLISRPPGQHNPEDKT